MSLMYLCPLILKLQTENRMENTLPPNFDMVYEFIIENYVEIMQMDTTQRENTLQWIEKSFDYVLKYEPKTEVQQ
jgi:hypothetical protein